MPATTSHTQRLLNDLYRPILKGKRTEPYTLKASKPKEKVKTTKPKTIPNATERKEKEMNATI